MNPASTAFVLGYHGCDRSVADRVLAGETPLAPSDNDYDWLGHGVYFWEHNARRAYEFACEIRDRPHQGKQPIKRPAVVGAVIDLAYCLNLFDSRYIGLVRRAYDDLVLLHAGANEALPSNSGGRDRLLRRLDCAVIETLHGTREDLGDPPFDTVRSAFVEGRPIYKSAGFAAKTHIQLCVRNPACIKGYFRPLGEDGKPLILNDHA